MPKKLTQIFFESADEISDQSILIEWEKDSNLKGQTYLCFYSKCQWHHCSYYQDYKS